MSVQHGTVRGSGGREPQAPGDVASKSDIHSVLHPDPPSGGSRACLQHLLGLEFSPVTGAGSV